MQSELLVHENAQTSPTDWSMHAPPSGQSESLRHDTVQNPPGQSPLGVMQRCAQSESVVQRAPNERDTSDPLHAASASATMTANLTRAS